MDRLGLAFLALLSSAITVQTAASTVSTRSSAEVLAQYGAAKDIDFGISFGKPKANSIPVEITVPVEQLRFVPDGDEVAARITILSVAGRSVRILGDAQRITAPANATPQGLSKFRFRLDLQLVPTRTSIVVIDDATGLGGTRAVLVDASHATLDNADEVSAADAAWRDALATATREKKMILALFRKRPCGACMAFERTTISHPTIARRLPSVAFLTLPADAGEAAQLWDRHESGVALFDRSGTLRARWLIVPDTMSFGMMIGSAIAVRAQFEQVVTLVEAGAPHDADVEAAIGLKMLERTAEAREALKRAQKNGGAATRQSAAIAEALFNLDDGTAKKALPALQKIAADPETPKVAIDAWTVIGLIQRESGATREAMHAFTTVAALAPAGTHAHTAAQQALDALRRTEVSGIGILPLDRQVVTGRHLVKTHVTSSAVARVAFSVDGREIARVNRPPFSLSHDFGAVPERHAIRAVAFGRNGAEIGRDERIVNDAGETFWLRLVSPRDGFASGSMRVSMDVRVPPARRINRVTVSWNDAQRTVLTSAPWECAIDIPSDQIGVLRAFAELDDGRTSEDAVLLNAAVTEQSNVQLIELPITIAPSGAELPGITPERITVTEGRRRRKVEAIATASETPLTIGVLIDVSASMQRTLPDVQEAAIRFLDTILGPRDRAFLVTFDTRARLLQPVTSDIALLRRRIMSFRPEGLTALYDAMALGLLQFEGVKGRRAMVVFTDGLDRTSQYQTDDVSELARRTNVPIHFIASVPGVAAAASAAAPEAPTHDALLQLARATGGTAHTLHDLATLPDVYSQIEAAVRAQILAFIRSDPAARENEWRTIAVRVEGVDVYAPAGYYAIR